MDYAGERRRLHTAPSTSSAQPSHLFDAGVELDQQFAYARRPMSGDASQSTYGTPWDLDWTQHSRSSAAEPPLPRHYEFVSLQHPSVHDQSSLVSPVRRRIEEPLTSLVAGHQLVERGTRLFSPSDSSETCLCDLSPRIVDGISHCHLVDNVALHLRIPVFPSSTSRRVPPSI